MFPVPKKAAYVKFRNQASRYALVGVFVAKRPSDVRVAVTGAGSEGVFRLTAFEEAAHLEGEHRARLDRCHRARHARHTQGVRAAESV